MLDIHQIRDNADEIKRALGRMGLAAQEIDELRAIDQEARELRTDMEKLRAEINSASKELARMSVDEREARRAELRAVGDRIKELEVVSSLKEQEIRDRLLVMPNIPDERVPDGTSEDDNVVVRTSGVHREFSFTPRPHWEVGESLGILDIERGIKLSGSRFYVLKGAGAALQRALISFMLSLHIDHHGYTEVYPPYVVKRECLVGTGQLPKFADNLYHDAEEDFWLVPTAEVPVTNLHRDEILDSSQLPIKYVAYTPCFRREKMSAGRDVRGIKRGHQFDKVEMVRLCSADDSNAQLEELTANAEAVCAALGLEYRTVLVCTGEKGEFNTMQYDIEVWAPASKGEEGGEWLEVSSCSNFGAYQARRANIRYRPAAGSRPEFVHTLNGSGLALPRVMIAILENYQREDGSVEIPDVLRPFMGGRTSISQG